MSQQTGLPTALPVTPGSGLQIPLSAIGAFLGLTEDVSPVISYSLESSAEVEVVVYSVQALVIRTLLTAKQYPGSYSITWDGKNDKGIIMPKGDYVAEVRIGKDRIVRKRIVVP
jgi:flagellar basal-body rod modification protein FlgD